MSLLDMILGAAAAFVQPEPLLNDIALQIPSLDGGRGLAVAYERFLPDREASLGASIHARESATGDYTAAQIGIGLGMRAYKHHHMAALAQPDGSMVGWFVGARVDLSLDATHDHADSRWLGTTIETGILGEAGYRFAIWRGLEITPSLVVGVRHDIDTSGRLPAWTRPVIGGGLAIGWLY